MDFPSKLLEANLVKRYKRFLADVIFLDGNQMTIYCPNPGSMTGLIQEGKKVWVQRTENSKAKFSFVWKLAEDDDGNLVCIDTQVANKIVLEALSLSKIPGLDNYAESYFQQPSRIGSPKSIKGLEDLRGKTRYSTAVGLLLYRHKELSLMSSRNKYTSKIGSMFDRYVKKLSDYFQKEL